MKLKKESLQRQNENQIRTSETSAFKKKPTNETIKGAIEDTYMEVKRIDCLKRGMANKVKCQKEIKIGNEQCIRQSISSEDRSSTTVNRR